MNIIRFNKQFIKQFEGRLILARILVGQQNSEYITGILKIINIPKDQTNYLFKIVPIDVENLDEDKKNGIGANLGGLVPVVTYYHPVDLLYFTDLLDTEEITL